jgi:biotin operon repressor
MNLMDDAAFLERVIVLMKRKSTGDANRFAAKLNMSKRSVQRLIQALKDEGYPIEFCKSSDSYILTKPVSCEFRVTVGDQDLMKIKGGRRPSLDLIGFENL